MPNIFCLYWVHLLVSILIHPCTSSAGRFGRRVAFSRTLFISGACLICSFLVSRILTGFALHEIALLVKVGFAICGKCFIAAAFAVAYFFASELFPTEVRCVRTYVQESVLPDHWAMWRHDMTPYFRASVHVHRAPRLLNPLIANESVSSVYSMSGKFGR